jgi:branched-chain amino acid transport system substrate-binding protein
MREGLQNITNYDANGLMAPVTVTSSDHGGGGKTRVEMWDGEKWVPQTEWIAAYTDLIWEVVRKSSSEYHN